MNLSTFIYTSVTLLIEFYAEQYLKDDFQATMQELRADFGVPRIQTYDFIVVGGGTAGCLVAGRLSQRYKILLLESGGNPPPPAAVRAFVSPVARAPQINYHFPSVPQSNLNGRILTTSIGRMMGGSGSHNSMIHNRGSPYDFDNWATIVGDESWSYGNVLKYFTKSEKFIGELYDEGEIGDDWYGYDGEYTIDIEIGALLPIWFEAGRELGFNISDPNGKQSPSFAAHHKSISNGKRVSTYNALIEPFEGTNANLTILRYADVSEILIDEQLKAYGVEYTRHGIIQRAFASKEVIVSGGAFRSPLLLMKSGIGPVQMLTEAGIKVKVAREGVGKNLGDHTGIVIGPIFVNDSSLFPRIKDGDEAEVLDAYHETGKGILANLGSPVQSFIVSNRAKAEGQENWPDIRLYVDMTPNGFAPAADPNNETLTIHVMAGRLKNRGWIGLNTSAFVDGVPIVNDDTKLSLIDFQFFNDPEDLTVIIDGIHMVLKIVEETKAFQKIGATLSPVPIAECNQFEFRSDDYWKCVIKVRAGNWNHLSGTCSMGKLDDPLAVVDTKLKVIGVHNLRVIDGSIMPVVPNANTNAAVIMLAEKGVQDILNMYRPPATTTTTTSTPAKNSAPKIELTLRLILVLSIVSLSKGLVDVGMK